MASIFTKIITGQIPCHQVAEDANHFAFMEISPLKKGHVLVIPKAEVDYIFDLEDKALAELMVFAKKVAVAVKKAVPCEKVAILVYGLEVRHAHIHLVPATGVAGELNFANKQKAYDQELTSISALIRSFLK